MKPLRSTDRKPGDDRPTWCVMYGTSCSFVVADTGERAVLVVRCRVNVHMMERARAQMRPDEFTVRLATDDEVRAMRAEHPRRRDGGVIVT